MDFALSWYTGVFINKITTQKFTNLLNPELIGIVILYVSFPLIMNIIGSWREYFQNKSKTFFQQHLDNEILLRKRAQIDIQVLENPKFTGLAERVSSNFWAIYHNIDYVFMFFTHSVFVMLAIVSIGFFNWWVSLVLILAILPDLYLEIKFGRKKWGVWSMNAEDRKQYWENRYVFNRMPSIIDFIIYNIPEYFLKKVQDKIVPFNIEITKTEFQRTKTKMWTKILLYAVNGAVIVYLMNDIVTGALLVGSFVFMIDQTNRMRNRLVELFHTLGKMNTDNHFLNDIFEFLDTKKVIKNGREKLGEGTPRVEFKGVSFKYPETDKFILEDISLTIEPGEKVAIVGVNGAGKTTFTKTLMRFYDVTSGEILIDGKNIKDIDINTFYEKLGYLPQDYARYRLTIAEAISISDPYRKSESKESTLDEIIAASKRAGSHEFIMGLEKGYNTQLGKEFEGGVEPSVGQWQKLALARLFYKNPQVWILDEPTASIDAVAEIEIFNELEKLPNDKTVILISHRFNTVKNADKIIVIEHGRIAEMGSHDELMSIESGHYKNLFNSQKDSYN
jgi:ATP-binding cassette subfamily B protein